MKYGQTFVAVVSFYLLVFCNAYAAPQTDVKDGSNNAVGEYFLPSGVSETHPTYYQYPNQDWGWQHHPVSGAHDRYILSVSAYDVDFEPSLPEEQREDDRIYVWNGSDWTLVGLLDGSNNIWAFTHFDLSAYSWIQQQVNSGLQVRIDVNYDDPRGLDPDYLYKISDENVFAVTLGKATLTADNGTHACSPDPNVSCSVLTPFSFNDVTDAELGTRYTSNAIQVQIDQVGDITSFPVSVSGGQYRVFNGSSWTFWISEGLPYTVHEGDRIEVRGYSSPNHSETTSVRLDIAGVSDSFDITTRTPDVTPEPFGFVDITRAELDTLLVSNSIQVTGIDSPASISVIGGEYRINGAAWTRAAATVVAGDMVEVQRSSANDFEVQVSATLNIGGVTDSFDITTRSANLTVDPFNLTDVMDANLKTIYTSDPITVSGPEQPVVISVSSGRYSINGGSWSSVPGYVSAGDTVAIRLVSANVYESTVSETLNIGGVTDNFDITTRSANLAVDPFNLTDVIDANLNTIYTSDPITVSGPELPVVISVSGGRYSINGGSWSSVPGYVSAGDTVAIRLVSANAYESTVSVILNVGGVSDSFDVTTRAADLTVNPFSFTNVTDAELGTSYISNVITVSGPELAVPIAIDNGQYRVNSGAWTSVAGNINAGDGVTVRRNSPNAYESTVSTTLHIGNMNDRFDITTRAAVNNVNAFSFSDVTSAELNTRYTSNSITVTGPEQAVAIAITNGQFSINGGTWTSVTGTVSTGDTVAVRRNSAGDYEQRVSTTLTIGGVSDAFDITTRAAVNTVDAFSFLDKADAELNTSYSSNSITVTGPEQAVVIAITNGQFSINGGTWTSVTGTVSTGDTVAVRRNSAGDYEQRVSTTLTIGGVSDAFDITTKALVPDTTPEPFSFVDIFDAEPSTSYTSNAITIMGVNTDTPVSILAGEYRINGGGWTSAAGSVVEGDVIEITRQSSAEHATKVGALLVVGSYNDSFDITTIDAADTTPDSFRFVDVLDAQLNQPYISNTVTISGIDSAVEVSIVGGEYRYNSGVWTNQSQYIVNGDVIDVRRNSSAEYSTSVSAVLTVGTVSDAFDITTQGSAGVCEAPASPSGSADMAKFVESELAGLEYSLDVWDSWSNGYCADIVVTNTMATAKPYPYGVHFTLPIDTQFTGTWSGDVQRNGDDVTVIFPSWTLDVDANSNSPSSEQFGFCAQGKSEPQGYTHYVPDFSNLSIDFIAHNVWDGGYCGHFEMTYSGNEAYIPAPNVFSFKLPQSVEITEHWNEHYTREGEEVTVDLPNWTYHLYKNSRADIRSGFCAVGEQLPCHGGYNGGNTTIVELTGIQDTYVAAGNAGSNYGDYPRVQADGMDSDNAEYVSLMKWDMSGVPQGVAVTGAQLTLNIYNDGGQYGLFAMHGAWSEMGATWYNSDIDTNQGMLIGVIEEGVFGQYTVSFNDRGIALVQQWADGEENHGFMIRSMGSHDGIVFDSGEDDIEALRPTLSVSYKKDAVPLAMPTMTQLGDGMAGYSGTQDSYVKSGSSSSNNYGGREYVNADGDNSSKERVGLLKWDLSSIPTSARLIATEINLQIFDSSSGQYNLYAMKGAWDEWNVRWENAHIDANQGVLIGRVVPRHQHEHTLMLNDSGVQLVQGWIDGSVANNGLMIRSAGTTSGMAFRSSEYSGLPSRPTVSVTYYE